MEAFPIVEPVFQAIHSRMGRGDDWSVFNRLTPLERAIYATRVIEGQIDNGGWYAVFYNNTDHWVDPAIQGYELLGLPEYAEHLRRVRAIGFGEDSPEPIGEAIDAEYFRLSGSEEARARALLPN